MVLSHAVESGLHVVPCRGLARQQTLPINLVGRGLGPFKRLATCGLGLRRTPCEGPYEAHLAIPAPFLSAFSIINEGFFLQGFLWRR